jgi:hypothetical protein
VVVNGDESTITFNDEIYIGGSTFLSRWRNTNSNPYMTGISALKGSSAIADAFTDLVQLYWYDENNNTYENPNPVANYDTYSNGEGDSAQIMILLFFIILRVMLLKNIISLFKVLFLTHMIDNM